MRARFGVLAALLFLVGGCATDRSALHPVGVSPRTDTAIAALGRRTPSRQTARRSRATPAARATVPTAMTVPARTMTAKALAGHMGLALADERDHVLLHDAGTHVRIWKDSGNVSVAGRRVTLSSRTHRNGRSLIVPAPMVQHVAREVGAQRKFLVYDVHARPPHLVHSEPGAVPKPRSRPAPKVRPRPAPKSIYEMPLAPKRDVVRMPPAAGGDPAWARHQPSTRKWRWIVLHHSDDTSGNFQKYERLHQDEKGWDECGYHFVIGNGTLSGDGQVEHGGRWYKQKHGAHCKTCDNRYNDYGIGICLVGDFETGGRPTARQMDALVRLCRWLVATYRIDPSDIVGHCDAKPTACPGKHFPWAELRYRVAAR